VDALVQGDVMVPNNVSKRGRIRALASAGSNWATAMEFRLEPGWGRFRDWFMRQAEKEALQRRLFPWIAVIFGLGVLLFFSAEGTPGAAAPLAAATAAGAAAFLARRHFGTCLALVVLAALCSGFAAAAWRTGSVSTIMLPRIVITPVSGFIEAIEDRPTGARIILAVTGMERVPQAGRPHRIRLTLRDTAGLTAGDHITAQARLLPPPERAWPGGYDFARDAYYRGIGAVGSALGTVQRATSPVPKPWPLILSGSLDEARNALTRRIASAIGGPEGAVAAALVTGKRGLIEESTNEDLRAAGLYHIVSISGLHMVLAAGTVFALTRAFLALFPVIALRWPIKKIAAVVSMIAATAYCIFSGSELATVRALVMTLIMLGAILANRPALSMRNLALAAIVVLVFEPEALLGPSFQMSYGAVAALIAASPLLQRISSSAPRGDVLARIASGAVRAAIALLGTTIIASLATAPFAAFHFQTFNAYGLIGNALALPLVSIAVMPAAVLGTVLHPFGLDGFIWIMMGWAVEIVLRTAGFVADLEGSTLFVPAIGTAAILAASLALLIATIPVSDLRYFAAIPAAAAIALGASPIRHDIFVDRDGHGAAVRSPDGRLVVLGRPPGFVLEQWLRADGDSRAVSDPALYEGARCDPAGCIAGARDGRLVSYTTELAALAEDCRRADVVISRSRAPPGCAAGLIIDRPVLLDHGAITVRFENEGAKIQPSRRPEGMSWKPSADEPDRRADPRAGRTVSSDGRD
jgi:competence protein ComEC